MNFKFWILLFITFTCGCTPTIIEKEIHFNSVPDNAVIKASSDKGLENFLIGKTPLTHKFEFGNKPEDGASIYNINFSHEGFEPETITIKKDDTKIAYDIELKKEQVREIPKLVFKVDEKSGPIFERRMVRAWIEDIEREGMAASSVVRLRSNQSISGMTISPTGKVLVFSLAENVLDEDGKEKTVANLRSVQTGGGGITQITSGQWYDVFPSFTQSGKHLVFASDRMSGLGLYRIATEKTGGIAVVRKTAEGFNNEPSNGDEMISFTYLPIYRRGISSSPQIWTLGGPNKYPTQLREGSQSSLSPDGTWIAFIGLDKQLWKMPVNGQNPVQLTSSPVGINGKSYPTWSPDGEYIVFISDEGKDSRDVNNNDIWMIREDGTNLRQLTTNGSDDTYPVVTPDQKHIVFVSNRGFKEGIWRIPFPESN